jgi:hypothetical protein
VREPAVVVDLPGIAAVDILAAPPAKLEIPGLVGKAAAFGLGLGLVSVHFGTLGRSEHNRERPVSMKKPAAREKYEASAA